jgi:hypothetical protein
VGGIVALSRIFFVDVQRDRLRQSTFHFRRGVSAHQSPDEQIRFSKWETHVFKYQIHAVLAASMGFVLDDSSEHVTGI